MEFVLDANVIISAIIKDSHVRHFLLFSGNSFFTPFEKIRVIRLVELQSYGHEAIRISPDPDDVHYVALALQRNCAIWSNDRALKEKQSVVRVYNSEQVLKMK